MQEVRKFLTVSASHLPRALAETLLRDSSGPRNGSILAGYYGLFVFARGEHPGYPESVQQLLAHAAADFDCSFVLFDSDGDELDGFAIYNEDEDR